MPLTLSIMLLFGRIEHRVIVLDDTDRNRFCEWLGRLLNKSHTTCYALALQVNRDSLIIQERGLTLPGVPLPTTFNEEYCCRRGASV